MQMQLFKTHKRISSNFRNFQKSITKNIEIFGFNIQKNLYNSYNLKPLTNGSKTRFNLNVLNNFFEEAHKTKSNNAHPPTHTSYLVHSNLESFNIHSYFYIIKTN